MLLPPGSITTYPGWYNLIKPIVDVFKPLPNLPGLTFPVPSISRDGTITYPDVLEDMELVPWPLDENGKPIHPVMTGPGKGNWPSLLAGEGMLIEQGPGGSMGKRKKYLPIDEEPIQPYPQDIDLPEWPDEEKYVDPEYVHKLPQGDQSAYPGVLKVGAKNVGPLVRVGTGREDGGGYMLKPHPILNRNISYIPVPSMKEIKYIEHALNSEVIGDTDGYSLNITALPNGNANGERIGNLVQSISLEAMIHIGLGTATVSYYTRVLVVIDENPDPVTDPLMGDVLAVNNYYAQYAADVVAKNRFTIIYDEMYDTTHDYFTMHAQEIRFVKYGLKHVIRFIGDLATDRQQGSIFLLALSNTDSGTDPVISGNVRYSYVDI